MHKLPLLQDLLIIFAVSITVVFGFQKLRLPSIAGFLVAGAIIGPHGLNLVSDLEQVQVLAEIGVVLLLFTIGLEFSLPHLTASRGILLVGGPLQVLSVVLLAVGVGWVVGVRLEESIFWGFLLALSSTAIVLKDLANRGESDTPHGRATLGILIFQDVIVVPMMLVTPFLASDNEVALTGLLIPFGKSAVLVALIIAGAWVVVPRFLDLIVKTRSRELFLLTVILLCLGIAWLTSLAGLSLALGAFIAGLVISESEYSHQAVAEVLPFRDSFNSLFFVSVGMLMNVAVVWDHPFLVVALVAAVLCAKFLAGVLSILILRYSLRSAILSGIALAQVGEFSFILAQEGQAVGLLAGEPYQVFLAVSVFTMIVTPFLIQWSPKVARRLEAVQRLRHWFPWHTEDTPVKGKSLKVQVKDHVIVVGYGLNGRNLARVLHETEIPYVILDYNSEICREGSKDGQPIFYGDAANPNVLRHLRINTARVLVLAVSDPFLARRTVQIARGLNPQLHIVVRTRHLKEIKDLHALGANEVVPEEFETSIEIFALVLRTYNMPQEVIVRKVDQVRREGYAFLRRGSLPELAHHLRGGTLADVEVETIRVDMDSPALGKTLAEVSIRSKTGASMLATTRGGVTDSNPTGKIRLEFGDIVVLMGTREQLRHATGLLVDTTLSYLPEDTGPDQPLPGDS